jgi:predicted nucleic acid-binding protein
MRGIQQGHQELTKVQDTLKEGCLKEVVLSAKKEKFFFEALSVSLGLGEASGLAAAKARGSIFVSDDRAARREAGLLDVKLTGTLGILRKAIRKKVIKQNECDIILAKMVEKGFYSFVRSLKDI